MIPLTYKILTPSGDWKSYKNLKAGDKVLAYSDGKLVSQEITSLSKTGIGYMQRLYHFSNKDGFNFFVDQTNDILICSLKKAFRLFLPSGFNWDSTFPITVSAPSELKQTLTYEEVLSDEQIELLTYLMAAGTCNEGKITVTLKANSNAADRLEELCDELVIRYIKKRGDDFGKETLVYYQLVESKQLKVIRKHCRFYRSDDPEPKFVEWDLHKRYDELLAFEICPNFVTSLTVRQADLVLNTWLTIVGKAGDYWELETKLPYGEAMLAYFGVITGRSVSFTDGKVYLFNRTTRECKAQVVDSECSEVKEVWGVSLADDKQASRCCVLTDEGWTFWTDIKS